MALFLHVLSPQNDVALVRPMIPKHFSILWCVKAQESSKHDRDRFAWARSGLRGNPRNEKHPGHGSPEGDREAHEGFCGKADCGIFLPVFSSSSSHRGWMHV